MEHRLFMARGHLIDSGILSSILNVIVESGADYNIIDFTVGKSNEQVSILELDVVCRDSPHLDEVTAKLVRFGAFKKMVPNALFQACPGDKCAPEGFYSTTNHQTDVFHEGEWRKVKAQRMDAVIARIKGGYRCVKLRDLKKGDPVLVGSESVHVNPVERKREAGSFGFMSNEVSSERSMSSVITAVSKRMREIKDGGGKIIAVPGPVVIHTGGAGALSSLVASGYIHGVLSGNALAVHDLESQLYGTSLGVSIVDGKPTNEGHRNHMRAINAVNHAGSIADLIEQGRLTKGCMYEIITNEVPCCLAASIRDDGPLPETVTDIIRAQDEYARILEGCDMVLMLSSMLHSIGVGNMLPSRVVTVCVDINPAVVTKLSDRGSLQTIGVVSDVGLFLRTLEQSLLS